jgi:hypothetical protein
MAARSPHLDLGSENAGCAPREVRGKAGQKAPGCCGCAGLRS